MRDLGIFVLGYFMGIIATAGLHNVWVHWGMTAVLAGLFYWFLFAGKNRIKL